MIRSNTRTTPNHAMERTADRLYATLLRRLPRFHSERRAVSHAVAHLVLVRSMMRLFLMLATLSYNTIGEAQTKSDEDAVRALPRAFCEAWAKHDGHQLATIM